MIHLTTVETGIAETQRRLRLMSVSFVKVDRHVADEGAKALLESLRTFVPKSTGRATGELKFEMRPSSVGWIARFFGPNYLKWVIGGRGEVWAGIYTGKSTKRFLRFEIGGREIFTTHVRAARGNDFRTKAVAASRPIIERIMHEAGKKVVRGELV